MFSNIKGFVEYNWFWRYYIRKNQEKQTYWIVKKNSLIPFQQSWIHRQCIVGHWHFYWQKSNACLDRSRRTVSWFIYLYLGSARAWVRRWTPASLPPLSQTFLTINIWSMGSEIHLIANRSAIQSNLSNHFSFPLAWVYKLNSEYRDGRFSIYSQDAFTKENY